jgi:hypothetical protein
MTQPIFFEGAKPFLLNNQHDFTVLLDRAAICFISLAKLHVSKAKIISHIFMLSPSHHDKFYTVGT